MDIEVQESFALLQSVCLIDDSKLGIAYKQMRDLLERLCHIQSCDESLQMTDLSARISYLAAKYNLSFSEQNRLHTFRFTSNAILNKRANPQRGFLLRDARTLSCLVRRIYGVDIPDDLYRLLPRVDAAYSIVSPSVKRIKRMRVCFQRADEQYLYVIPADEIVESLLRVRYNVAQVNIEFSETCKLLWRHAQLNLLDVAEDENGVLTPSFIVLEPDYLIDISSLAECYKDYGHHPANYIYSELQPIENTCPLLLGNIANLFLDELIHAKGEVAYLNCMQKAFRKYSIELAACRDLQNEVKERQFFKDCRMHFDHISQVVNTNFEDHNYSLDKTDAVLEPSYICEALGLQGRLDYMQRDMTSFIEMKSGRADEYSIHGKIEPKENNRVQMLLYLAMLYFSMGMDYRKVKSFLLYTRYPLLYPARPSWAMVRRSIDLRNRIVADEFHIQLYNNSVYTASKLREINANTLNEKKMGSFFWKQYLRPSIDCFTEKIERLSALEKSYFYALFNFITKELYLSKSGDVDYDNCKGASSLWLSTLADKYESGEIITGLTLKVNKADEANNPYLIVARTSDGKIMDSFDESVLGEIINAPSNFRIGDFIVLYERNTDIDNVTNKMIFKGTIESMSSNEIRIRLRSPQSNLAVLPLESHYGIEHDYMDSMLRGMYKGLYAFASATQQRRDLLLGVQPPEFDESMDETIAHQHNDFVRVTMKARAAKNYFLLVGPPGTGKTSCALKKMVNTFYCEDNAQILLLAYTNRAVDEICKSLSSISPEIDFIRIGSELSCDKRYRNHLLSNQVSGFTKRDEVVACIQNCHLFTGTIASISAKPELFELKHFDMAIIDESTQILEPQLLYLFTARNADGDNAIGKFIMIGDYKQLPAVVLQKSEQSAVKDELLRDIGLCNLKDSLFERLYRTARKEMKDKNNRIRPSEKLIKLGEAGKMSNMSDEYRLSRSFDMLSCQGRMHPVIASFTNDFFYRGCLRSANLPHQKESSEGLVRLAFFPSIPNPEGFSAKCNHDEAKIVAKLSAKIYQELHVSFDASQTLGIITPYRSQIALIKQEISLLGISQLNEILVDTVERFQGSERDIIIYSFSVNHSYQLNFLSNVIEDEGVLIDRKLNVALTRARKRLFITGVPQILELNPIYKKLIHFIQTYTY